MREGENVKVCDLNMSIQGLTPGIHEKSGMIVTFACNHHVPFLFKAPRCADTKNVRFPHPKLDM
jgi:hypothetical protein